MKPSPDIIVRQLEGDMLRLQIHGKTFLAAGACPHRKDRLAYGYINPRKLRIACPLHHSVFDLQTGRPVTGPATGCLRVTPVEDGPPAE